MKFTFPPESRPLEGYTIKRAIFRGGFGEVYYAQSDAGREVALKLLQNNAEIELRGVQQCLNLSHPNLVTIFDIRQDGDGDHWIVMEYVAGETLDAILRRSPNGLPVETIRKWLKGMTDGIAYLHSRGLVHRDMKPANMFMENGIVKIGDVGLSKFISPSRHSAQTQSVGTVHYMAPEVAKGKYGREVDVYAMGVILYEMLTGELPFDGESTGEILMKHLSEQPDLSKLPPRLQPVIGQALAKDPHDRFSRVEALQRAFDDAVLGIGPVPNTPASSVTRDSSTAAEPRIEKPGRAHLAATQAMPHKQSTTGYQGSPGWLVGGLAALGLTALTIRYGGPIGVLELLIIIGLGGLVGHLWIGRNRPHRTKAASPTGPPPAVNQAVNPAVPRPVPSSNTSSLFGSLFATVPISAALIGCMTLIKPSLLGNARSLEQVDLGLLGLFSAVTIVASWGILLMPRVYGVRSRKQKIPAFHFAVLGGVVGAIAYLLDNYLMVESIGGNSHGIFNRLGDHVLFVDGAPSVGGYLAFFAAFFGCRNWQEMTSPFRKTRFSISAVLVTVFVAWLATVFFSFPGQLAIAWGVIIGCVTQLAAPVFERPTKKYKRYRRVRRVA